MKEYSPAFYRFVDYSSCMLIGLLSVVLPYLLIPKGWGMVTAMSAGMVMSMAAAFFVSIALSSVSGFETAVPGTVIGMTFGMVPTDHLFDSIVLLALAGAVAGGVIALVFHLYDNSLHGEVRQ
jgi:hypothetical protein